MKTKLSARRHLKWLIRRYPEGFEGCGNTSEMLQRLDWLQHGVLKENLTGEKQQEKVVKEELEAWKDFEDYHHRLSATIRSQTNDLQVSTFVCRLANEQGR